MTVVDEIKRVVDFPHRPERVWQAVTDPAQVAKWFGDRVHYELTAGAHMTMEWDEFGDVSGRIEIVAPIHHFAFRWRATGIPETEPMTPQNSTVVNYYLEPIAAGTRLTVIETGFATLPPALRAAALRENNNGWDAELFDLQTYLANQPL